MTIYFIAPGGAYKIEMKPEMPEFADAVIRAAEFYRLHPNCYMVNMCGRLNGQIGSYVVYACQQ